MPCLQCRVIEAPVKAMRDARRVFSRAVTQVGYTARTSQKSLQEPSMSIVVSKDTEGLFRHKVTFPEA